MVSLLFSFVFFLVSGRSSPATRYDIYQPVLNTQTPVSLCDRAASQVSPFYGVPERMLRAMSFVETGIYHPELAAHPSRVPSSWPWTLQVDGKAYYFATKKEAVDTANGLLARGVHNFDVGCMQVNMLHHGDAFASMDEAFDPVKNVRYAARFLLALWRESGAQSWDQAMGAYHSKTPSIGRLYKERVKKAIGQV